MKKNKFLILSLLPLVLCGCEKTNSLYKSSDYNSSNFDDNYYVDYDGLDKLTLIEENKITSFAYPEGSCFNYGEDKHLSLAGDGFKKGIVSKLYDGRTWCGGLFQLSRVQLDKTGFGTKFPYKLASASTFEFAARGGTSPNSSKLSTHSLHFNITISLYTSQKKINYVLNDVALDTDNGGYTTIVSFPLTDDAIGAIGYSMKFECTDTAILDGINTTDDKTVSINEKDHLALMLYEVMLPNSTWIK